MKRKCLVAAVTLLCFAGFASAQVDLSFESPTYTTGNLAPSPAGTPGQDGWYWYTIPTEGITTVQVISGDNGPTDTGTQCLEITAPVDAYPGGHIRIHKLFADAVQQGPLVTFQYDFKWVNSEGDPVPGVNIRPRVLDSINGDGGFTGIAMSHSNAMDFDYYGSSNPDGSGAGFIGQRIGDMLIDRTTADDWHTITWVAYYGNQMGADYGQLLYGAIDGVRTPWIECFFPANVAAADLLQLRILSTGNPGAVFRMDNIKVFGQALPSALPTADAGADQNNIPSGYDGAVATLPAGGVNNSFDDGSVDYYMWTLLGSWPETKLSFSDVDTKGLPANTSGTVRLTVIDDDGMVGTDTFDFTTLAPTPVPVDNLQVPFSTKNGDIYGTGQNPNDAPATITGFQTITQKTGGAFGWSSDDPGDRQYRFDVLGNLYRLCWTKRFTKVDPDFNLQWESPEMQGGTLNVQHESTVVLIGERHSYVVSYAGNDVPALYAYDKVSGAEVWHLEFDNGVVAETPNNRPIAILLNNKIYYFGAPYDKEPVGSPDGLKDTVRLWRVDCGSDTPGPVVGSIDWVAEVPWGSELPRNGNAVIVPTDARANEVTIVIAGRSGAADDGLPDMIGVDCDDTGVVSTWGIDGVLADLSAVIYSATEGKFMARSQDDNWGNYGCWVIDPAAPNDPNFSGGITTAGNANPKYDEEAWVLSNDGTTVYSAGKNGWIYSYDIATRTADAAYFEIKDPNDPNGPYNADFGSNAILTQQPNGTEILITPYKIRDYEGGKARGAICAFDMTNAVSGTPDEGAIDDGPMYFDNVVISIDGTPVLTESFEGYAVGTFNPCAPWSFTGTVGTEATARIVDLGAPHGKVLELNPYGGNSYDISAMTYDLGTAYDEFNCYDIVVTWDQYKSDKTDNAWTGDEYYVFQWDGGGDPGSQLAWSGGVSPDWSLTANLTAGVWEPVVMTIDYYSDLFDMTVSGTNTGGTQPFLSADGLGIDFKQTDVIEFGFQATPPTSSGWTPPTNYPVATHVVGEGVAANDWYGADGLTVSPNGDYYYMEFGNNYQRRWTRLRLTGESGPDYKCGDADGDGSTDV
ncbi:MAG: hypothetical protein JXO22_06420, partial [Phycisphaerae bacterium]|nr:hypothetical protein [Phycisphaerae bacterium]